MDLTRIYSEKFLFFFQIPHVQCRSVDEYFNLSRKEREWHGLYRKPFGLPLEGFSAEGEKGWKSFYEEIKKEYPFQYFLREWLPTCDNPVVFAFKKFIQWPWRDFSRSVRLFFKPCYKRWRSVLPRWEYSDAQHLIVEGNFAILRDFYHEEVVDGIVDWDYDELHKNFKDKLQEYVKWVEEDRKVLDEKLSEELSKATKNKIFVDKKLDYIETYKSYHELEKEIKEKETEILKWMIDNRELFWS